MHKVEYLSIKPNYISLYSLPEKSSSRSSLSDYGIKNLQDNEERGVMSKKSSKRVREAINWLLYITKEKPLYIKKWDRTYKFKVNFITLTLPSKQIHTDLEIKRECLQPFLDYARKRWKIKNYVWRAEAQVNGNIHFHIVGDVFIPWNELRNKWNQYVNKLGYVDRFRVIHPGKTPNSTDVHAIKKIRDLSSYLSEYCAKQTKGSLYTPCKWENGKLVKCENLGEAKLENTPYEIVEKKGRKKVVNSVRCIFGRQWRLSYGLSKLKSVIEVSYGQVYEELERIWNRYKEKVRVKDYVTMIFVSISEWQKMGLKALNQLVKNYVYSQLNPT